jgi:hypothetical protein
MKQAIGVLCCVFAVSAAAQPEPEPAQNEWTYLQVWLGALGTDESWEVSDPTTGETAVGDIGTLPFGGGVGQQMWGSGRWQIGYEGGALATWKNDSTEFRGSSNVLLIKVDNTFWSFGVFMGGVVSVDATRNLRLYVAAGPAVTWAWLDDDDDDDDDDDLPDPPPNNTFFIDLNDGSNDVSIVAYARAGAEIILNDGFSFGVSVRYADDEFDFDEAGELELDEPLWLLTLGARL